MSINKLHPLNQKAMKPVKAYARARHANRSSNKTKNDLLDVVVNAGSEVLEQDTRRITAKQGRERQKKQIKILRGDIGESRPWSIHPLRHSYKKNGNNKIISLPLPAQLLAGAQVIIKGISSVK